MDELRVLIDRVLYIWPFVEALEYIVASLEKHVDEATQNFRAVNHQVLGR